MKIILFLSFLILNTTFAQVNITFYNQGFAVVNEKKNITFNKDTTLTLIGDFSPSVNFDSFEWSEVPFQVLEQKIIRHQAKDILHQLSGQQLIFHRGEESFQGFLQTIDQNNMLNIKTSSGKFYLFKTGPENYIEIGKALMPKPERISYSWKTASTTSGNVDISLSYLVQGLVWQAVYSGNLSEDGQKLTLSCWINLQNNTDFNYLNTHVAYLAGDIHHFNSRNNLPAREDSFLALTTKSGELNFQSNSFMDYRIYRLPQVVNLEKRSIVKEFFLETKNINVNRKYYVKFRRSSQQENASIRLSFLNTSANGLGVILPGGTIKVYKGRTPERLLMGEDNFNPSHIDERVNVEIGKAFDLKCEIENTKTNKIDRRTEEQSFRVKLHNLKNEDVDIYVYQSLHGDWELVEGDEKYSRSKEGELVFNIPVEKNKAHEFAYTIKFKY